MAFLGLLNLGESAGWQNVFRAETGVISGTPSAELIELPTRELPLSFRFLLCPLVDGLHAFQDAQVICGDARHLPSANSRSPQSPTEE
jgi:hypothetical protein